MTLLPFIINQKPPSTQELVLNLKQITEGIDTNVLSKWKSVLSILLTNASQKKILDENSDHHNIIEILLKVTVKINNA
jgi:hypothetical protein